MADFFKVLKSVISKDEVTDEDIETHYNGFMTMRMLSQHPQAVWQSNFINTARGNKLLIKEKKAEYLAIRNIITIPRNTYIKTPKQDKNKKIIISFIQKHFKVGPTTAEQYMKILGKERLVEMLEKHSRKNEKHFSASELSYISDLKKAISYLKKGVK